MSCANCRKPARVTRQPSVPKPTQPKAPAAAPKPTGLTNDVGSLKGRMTGLRYGDK